jgi:septal ring factor EnvC (AmiA/AmiB activator)
MKFSKLFFFLCIAAAYFNVGFSQAQTRKQLEVERKKIKQEIVKVNKLLFATQKKGENALEDLKDINQKIATRSNYINLINKESSLLSSEINQNQRVISKLNQKLERLKKDYAEMIFKSYKSKSKQSQLLFLMSSQSFQQAYKRLQYMKQYTKFRKRQGEQISIQSSLITKFNDSLLFKKQAKDTLIKVEESEKLKIESDKKDKEKLVSLINRRASKYKREIRTKQKEERKIANKIDAIIKAAIAKSNRNKANKNAKGFALTPEAKALAKRFEQNRGKLPWPVSNGLVVRRYGTQRHPTLSGITVTSPGLHIATNKGTYAQSVFNGKVLAIILSSGGKKAVIIQHGNYLTTYNNLETLSVKKGDAVTTGQTIGKIFTNRITQKTTLIFVLHKETQRQNPKNWLVKR